MNRGKINVQQTIVEVFCRYRRIWLFFGLVMTVSVWAQDASVSAIASQYKDKLVTLRGSYCGQQLKFDADAKLVSRPVWGNWETCQGMIIRNVQVADDKIKIAAQRVPISYDCETKQVRDLSQDV